MKTLTRLLLVCAACAADGAGALARETSATRPADSVAEAVARLGSADERARRAAHEQLLQSAEGGIEEIRRAEQLLRETAQHYDKLLGVKRDGANNADVYFEAKWAIDYFAARKAP